MQNPSDPRTQAFQKFSADDHSALKGNEEEEA